MQQINLQDLKREAKLFCEEMSKTNHAELFGITDGKAVGTYVEHKFQERLQKRYDIQIGNSAYGIDLPDENLMTDIKVTSVAQPQSSSPFKDARQKIFGLGYHLLVFVYEKIDARRKCHLLFHSCTFIDRERTGDYTLTKRLREMLDIGANEEDIVALLNDHRVPGDEITYANLAHEILQRRPEQGYLTISNALQWRLQYGRVIKLQNSVPGVTNYEWHE